MFGFGKRHKPDDGKHVVPPVMWDDPANAAFFARIGAKPDDADNLRVTHDDVRRMIEEGRKAVDGRIHKMKAKALADGHGDVHLGMFWLIQEPCWNGEVGDFLIYQLKLNPYEEWNTIVAGDERAARLLGIPLHPGGVIPYLAEGGQKILLQLRDKLRAAHQEVQRTHEFGRFQDIFEDTQAKVKKLAQMFGEEMVESTGNILRQRDEAQRGNP